MTTNAPGAEPAEQIGARCGARRPEGLAVRRRDDAAPAGTVAGSWSVRS